MITIPAMSTPKLANKDMCDVKISLVNKVKIFFTAI